MSIKNMTVQELLEKGYHIQVVSHSYNSKNYDEASDRLLELGINDFDKDVEHPWLRYKEGEYDNLTVNVFYESDDE